MVTSVVMKDDDLERIYDVLEVTKGLSAPSGESRDILDKSK